MKKSMAGLVLLMLVCSGFPSAAQTLHNEDEKITIYFFYKETCQHCAREKVFLDKLESKYPRLEIIRISVVEEPQLFEEMLREYGSIPVGVPRTIIGGKVFVGFSSEEGSLEWYDAYKGYYGYGKQMENEIRELMNLAPLLCECGVVEISKEDEKVKNLLDTYPDSKYSIYLADEIYTIGWWSPDRINSELMYPDVLVKLNAKTGELIESTNPDSPVEGVKKPVKEQSDVLELLIGLFLLYAMLYVIFRKKIHARYWISVLFLFIIASLFIIIQNVSEESIIDFAKGFSFPGFVFIIALVDGFNPCAFFVLGFLLSLLTYTKSRGKMLLIGAVFILTSGLMYSLFIIVLLTIRTELLSEYQGIIRLMVAAIALVAGLINIKDFFYFKKGVSLTMSDKSTQKIFSRIRSLVNSVREAQTGREMLIAVLATVVLASMVNFIELGCTLILPMQYLEVLLNNYSEPVGLMHILYTVFYGVVYIIPLFAILGGFIYSFKSEKISEKQARVLKLVGGLIMLTLGLVLLFKPELLIFG